MPAHEQPITAPHGEAGFALLIVLWILTAASLLVASYMASVRASASAAMISVDIAKVESLLSAGQEIAAAHLIDVRDGVRWSPDASRHKFTFAGADLTISIADPNGLIDLNKSDDSLLRSFFRRQSSSRSAGDSIVDAILTARKAVAERGTRMAPFVTVDQLRGAILTNRTDYDRMAPYLTVYNRNGLINPQYAPREVLESVPGIAGAEADHFVKSRDSASLSAIMEKAHAYLTDQKGPGFLVVVTAHFPGTSVSACRVSVIAIGLDSAAPYRLISMRPVVMYPKTPSKVQVAKAVDDDCI